MNIHIVRIVGQRWRGRVSELINNEKKVIKVGEPIIFENKTSTPYDVSAGIVFRKSGIYEIMVTENITSVSKIANLTTGQWVKKNETIKCSNCEHSTWSMSFEHIVRNFNYCPYCGAKMQI